jgi:hypothetical protein
MKHFVSAAMAAVMLAGCATQPDQISAQYVSPIQYQGWSCDQIKGELVRVSNEVDVVTGQQRKKATDDAIAMGVGLVVFWPALFFLAVGQDKKDELGRLKGEYDALNAAAVQNHCVYAAPPVPPGPTAAK